MKTIDNTNLKLMKQSDFIRQYLRITPRPDFNVKGKRVFSYYYEENEKGSLKRIDVEILLEKDLSYLIAQISYASEFAGVKTALSNVMINVNKLSGELNYEQTNINIR